MSISIPEFLNDFKRHSVLLRIGPQIVVDLIMVLLLISLSKIGTIYFYQAFNKVPQSFWLVGTFAIWEKVVDTKLPAIMEAQININKKWVRFFLKKQSVRADLGEIWGQSPWGTLVWARPEEPCYDSPEPECPTGSDFSCLEITGMDTRLCIFGEQMPGWFCARQIELASFGETRTQEPSWSEMHVIGSFVPIRARNDSCPRAWRRATPPFA